MDKKLIMGAVVGLAVCFIVAKKMKGQRNPWLDPAERLPFGLTAEDLLSGEYDDDDDDDDDDGPDPFERLPMGYMAPG